MTSRSTASKLLLVTDGRIAANDGSAVRVRRYRLARMVADDGTSVSKSNKANRG